jgi:hypothetical protein
MSYTALFNQYARRLALLRVEREDAMVRQVVAEWLPRRLAWLVDRPRLLRLYLRIPHRTRPFIERRLDGSMRVVVR